jgi:ubiquinone/menaquinone biosynthesis C-methylase UbiE
MILNKLCELEDWQNLGLRDAIRVMSPHMVRAFPDYPDLKEHRKAWEYAQLFSGLQTLGALRADAVVLGVAAGHESPLYELTKHVRWVFATDIYGAGVFTGHESDATMLHNPDQFALDSYNRNRLVVQYMDARDLRFEPETFDIVYCLSSIEHFGGEPGARTALLEMQRVMKPGAVLMLTTECIVNGADPLSIENLELFSPEALTALLASVPQLKPIEEISFKISHKTLKHVIPLERAVNDGLAGHTEYPHIVLELSGRQFTSVSVFLRKAGESAAARDATLPLYEQADSRAAGTKQTLVSSHRSRRWAGHSRR